MEKEIDLAAIKGPITSLFPAVKNCDDLKSNEDEDMEGTSQLTLPQDRDPVLDYACILQSRTIPPLNNVPRDEFIKRATSYATSELEKELRSVLVKVASEEHLPKVIASPCPVKAQVSEDINLLEEPNSAWFDNLANSSVGSSIISTDIKKLMEEMSKGLEEGLPGNGHNLTLLVPDTHMKYLTFHTSSCCSALESLKTTYPELKVVAIQGLHTAAYSFALLVYTSDTFGPAGYVVLDSAIKLNTAPRQIELPKYRLTITNLSQMAVLEGI